MIPNKITPKALWEKQQICGQDVDYNYWNKKRESILEMSQISQNCIFTVDVFRKRYDFASENFTHIFGYNPAWIKNIQKQGDLLEERIHPDDRAQIAEYQIEHGLFIYSLPPECRNDYKQVFQFRVLNARDQYVNVISSHQVFQQDRNGKAWIVMGLMDLSPDQSPTEKVKRTVLNRMTGEIITSPSILTDSYLSNREKEILFLIRQGLLSKEIAAKLKISIHTVSNHRKNILSRLKVDNVIEAINTANKLGIL